MLKPLVGGSSRGLYFVGRGDPIPNVCIPYIVEQFLSGRELTCGVIAAERRRPRGRAKVLRDHVKASCTQIKVRHARKKVIAGKCNCPPGEIKVTREHFHCPQGEK